MGRGWYERSGQERPKGHRNGYRPKTFKSRSGPVDVQLPRIRQTGEDFESVLLDRLGSIEQCLKILDVEMYTRVPQPLFVVSDGGKGLKRV